MAGRFRHMPPLDTLVAFESVARLQSFTRAALMADLRALGARLRRRFSAT